MQPEGSEAHAPSSSTVDSQAAAVASAAAAEGSEANHARPQWFGTPAEKRTVSKKPCQPVHKPERYG